MNVRLTSSRFYLVAFLIGGVIGWVFLEEIIRLKVRANFTWHDVKLFAPVVSWIDLLWLLYKWSKTLSGVWAFLLGGLIACAVVIFSPLLFGCNSGKSQGQGKPKSFDY